MSLIQPCDIYLLFESRKTYKLSYFRQKKVKCNVQHLVYVFVVLAARKSFYSERQLSSINRRHQMGGLANELIGQGRAWTIVRRMLNRYVGFSGHTKSWLISCGAMGHA